MPISQGQQWLLCCTNFSQAVMLTMPFTIAVFMVRDFYNARDEQKIGQMTGLLAAAMSFASCLTSIPWGYISDSYGRKPVLVVGSAVSAVAILWFGFSASYASAISARIVGGIFNGILGAWKTMIGEVCNVNEQGSAMGKMSLAWGLGSIAGPAVGGVLSRPCDNLPGVPLCGPNGLLEVRPYLLPCFMACMTCGAAFVLDWLWLEETLPSKRRPITTATTAHGGFAKGARGYASLKSTVDEDPTEPEPNDADPTVPPPTTDPSASVAGGVKPPAACGGCGWMPSLVGRLRSWAGSGAVMASVQQGLRRGPGRGGRGYAALTSMSDADGDEETGRCQAALGACGQASFAGGPGVCRAASAVEMSQLVPGGAAANPKKGGVEGGTDQGQSPARGGPVVVREHDSVSSMHHSPAVSVGEVASKALRVSRDGGEEEGAEGRDCMGRGVAVTRLDSDHGRGGQAPEPYAGDSKGDETMHPLAPVSYDTLIASPRSRSSGGAAAGTDTAAADETRPWRTGVSPDPRGAPPPYNSIHHDPFIASPHLRLSAGSAVGATDAAAADETRPWRTGASVPRGDPPPYNSIHHEMHPRLPDYAIVNGEYVDVDLGACQPQASGQPPMRRSSSTPCSPSRAVRREDSAKVYTTMGSLHKSFSFKWSRQDSLPSSPAHSWQLDSGFLSVRHVDGGGGGGAGTGRQMDARRHLDGSGGGGAGAGRQTDARPPLEVQDLARPSVASSTGSSPDRACGGGGLRRLLTLGAAKPGVEGVEPWWKNEQVTHSAGQQGTHSTRQEGTHSTGQEGTHSTEQEGTHSNGQEGTHSNEGVVPVTLNPEPWWKNEQVRLVLAGYSLTCLLACTMDELLPLYAAAPKEKGGLGLSEQQIALPLMLMGTVVMVYSLWGFPLLQRMLGTLRICIIGFWVGLLPMFIIPATNMVVMRNPDWAMVLLLVAMALRGFAQASSFTAAIIMVNLAPHPSQLGSVNGCGQTLAAFVRGVGPAAAGMLWAASLGIRTPGHQFLGFLLLLVVVAAALVTFHLVKPPAPVEVEPKAKVAGME